MQCLEGQKLHPNLHTGLDALVLNVTLHRTLARVFYAVSKCPVQFCRSTKHTRRFCRYTSLKSRHLQIHKSLFNATIAILHRMLLHMSYAVFKGPVHLWSSLKCTGHFCKIDVLNMIICADVLR